MNDFDSTRPGNERPTLPPPGQDDGEIPQYDFVAEARKKPVAERSALEHVALQLDDLSCQVSALRESQSALILEVRRLGAVIDHPETGIPSLLKQMIEALENNERHTREYVAIMERIVNEATNEVMRSRSDRSELAKLAQRVAELEGRLGTRQS